MNTAPRLASTTVLLVASCAAPSTTDAPATRAGAGTGTVNWQDWKPETFALAKAENRLILVDVVAEWCHWCHVMDKTTYVDADVAREIDADYLPIRVDSDARPDVAERYREWGWPATAILTPDAKPVLELRGYQEPADFARTLKGTADDFRAGREVARVEPSRKAAGPADLAKVLDSVETQLDSVYDASETGWGRPQKYPYAAPVEHALLRAGLRGDAASREHALATLAKETKIVDPVWGGMYQYSTNGDWDHPHFEKIVPVQAGAIANFAQAARITGNKEWLGWTKSVLRYVKDFLTAEDGAFYTSQDADLGAHNDAPEWVDGHKYFALDDVGRRAQGIPRIDTNVYADRNGLLIAALCEYYEASQDGPALAAARKAANRIARTHAGPTSGFTHGDAASAGADPTLFLADQVEMGRAFLALAQAGADPGRVAAAERVGDAILDRFEDKVDGGFWANTVDRKAIAEAVQRQKPFEENARAARFLLRLHAVTGETLWREAAERALRFFGDPAALREEGRAVGDYASALEELEHAPMHLAVVGKPGAKDTNALYAESLRVPVMHRLVEFSTPGDKYPDIGKAAVYVCTETSCSSPVTDVLQLAQEVKSALALGK